MFKDNNLFKIKHFSCIMSEVLEELREHLRESGRRRGILEALLYHSMNVENGEIMFPTPERFIFNEVIR